MNLLGQEEDWQSIFGSDPFGRRVQAPPIGRTPPFFPQQQPRNTSPQAARPPVDLGQLGLLLLAQSGASPQKRGIGEILGQTGLQYGQMQGQKQDDEIKRKYMEAQIGAMGQKQAAQSPFGNVNPGDFTPASLEKFRNSGNFNDLERIPQERAQVGDPSSVREHQYYESLTPAQKKEYLQVKRALQIEKINEVPNILDPGGAPRPLSTLPQITDAAAQLEQAKATGATAGKTQTEAVYDLPRVEANAKQTIELIDKIKTHPGLKYGVGLWSKAPVVPGTQQADFVALTEQLQGKQFLEAYQALKGGGSITEVEGTKAENAIARMQRAQSQEAFISAATEFQDIVKLGVERARKKAGQTGETPNTKRIKVDAQGNVIGN